MSLLPIRSASPHATTHVRGTTRRGTTAAAVAGRAVQAVVATYLLAIVAAVVAYKAAFIEALTDDPFFGVYGLVVVRRTSSPASRSASSTARRADAGLEPRVAIVMPAFNEEDAIGRSLRSLLAVDYPADKLEIVVVNDGSTDGTLREIRSGRPPRPAAGCA